MSSKIFELKKKLIQELPEGELPWSVFGRLMVKTGILWSRIDEKTEVSPEQFEKAIKAVEELLGKKIDL